MSRQYSAHSNNVRGEGLLGKRKVSTIRKAMANKRWHGKENTPLQVPSASGCERCGIFHTTICGLRKGLKNAKAREHRKTKKVEKVEAHTADRLSVMQKAMDEMRRTVERQANT